MDIARSCYHRPLRSELREVPLFLGGTTSGQAQLGLIDSQRHLFTLDTWEGTKPDLEVRLYRPGWRTARVHSWELIDQISWEHAVTREEKEGAVDELLFAWYKDPPCWHLLYAEKPEGMEISPSGGEYLRAALAPGSQSKGHRDALLFAAAEYERLMISFKNDGADNKVLTPLAAKAKALRDLANE